MGVENDFETQPERSGAEGGKGLFVERGKKKEVGTGKEDVRRSSRQAREKPSD